jgi:hypothetical protein
MIAIPSSELLKTQLQKVRESKFQPLPEIDPFTLAQEMLAHIGSTDPELRDRLIYTTFVYWIEPDYIALFTPEQLRAILNRLLDADHLFHGIGEKDTDSVFTRSFSALTIAPILIYHRERPFLSPDELQNVKTQLIRYVAEERDFRGYVEGKGWAHAIAHTADALNELALCTEMGQMDLHEILQAVTDAASNSHTIYAHQEEDRLMEVVDSINGRDVFAYEDWEGWWMVLIAPEKEEKPFPESYYKSVNLKHFLQSLYVRSEAKYWHETFRRELMNVIKDLFRD